MSSATAADKYVYDDVLESEVLEKPFISKEMATINDSNNGQYNNQIQFSTGQMNNTGKWVDFQNSYLEVPFTMAMKSSTDITTANYTNAFQMGLKDSSLQIIDSISLQYNGTGVIQNSIFTNVIQHFKILASWTQEDLTKWGAATVTAPDTTTSFRFSNAAASAFGDGTTNNSVAPPTMTAALWNTDNYSYNEGYLKRLRYTGLNPNGAVNGLQTETPASSQFIGKNYWSNDAGAAAARIYYWQVLLTIRCKDLSDFFCKIPLMKSAKIDMTIYFNAFGGTVTYNTGAGAAANGTLITTSFNQISGHTCPFMLSAGAVLTAASNIAQPMKAINPAGASVDNVLSVGCGINGVRGVTGLTGIPTGAITNCRWLVPTFEMDPEYEQHLLATNPVKTIYYDDFYTFPSIVNQTGSFSVLLTAGVKNPQYVVLFPFYSAAVGVSGNTLSNSPYQSFFDTAPATTSPCSLTNFQVQCGGRSIFPQIQQYSYQQFMDEFSSIFALNGGKSDIVTSGLLSKFSWECAPVYVCNISRRLPQDDGTSKSIQVTATINSKDPTDANASATLDVLAFVVYQRRCDFNLLNGLLVSDSI